MPFTSVLACKCLERTQPQLEVTICSLENRCSPGLRGLVLALFIHYCYFYGGHTQRPGSSESYPAGLCSLEAELSASSVLGVNRALGIS